MDHFNSTIRDGELVNTRRGLQVSRQKFNGLSFVNAYPQSRDPPPPSPGSRSTPSSDKAKPTQRQFKFVDPPSVSRQSTSRSQRQSSDTPTISEFLVPDIGTSSRGKKPRRRLTTRDQSSAASPTPSSRRSSHASSNASSVGGGEGFHRSQTPRSQNDTSSSSAAADFRRSHPLTGGGNLSAWQSSPGLPADMPEENWRPFHRYFATLPGKIYPFEDILSYNPARSSEFYDMHVKDAAAVQIVLMCGSVATAIVSGERHPKGLAYHISFICSILNRKLDQNAMSSRTMDHVTLLCITALAASACYVGRLDHWHMHMRGLQKALDVNGGLGGLPVWLLNKMHLTDLDGAATLASAPYLSYTPKFDPISNILPPPLRSHIYSSLSTLLTPLNINTAVMEALSSLSIFTSTIRLARSSSGAVTFDPHAFTDEWLSVRHGLVTQPEALINRPAHSGSPFNPYDIPGAGDPDTGQSDDSPRGAEGGGRSELYMGSHRLRASVPISPAEVDDRSPLEPALRAAALLYLKELLPNWPRNLGGYAVLLRLLRVWMGVILNNSKRQEGDERGVEWVPRSGGGKQQQQTATATTETTGGRKMRVSNTGLGQGSTANKKSQREKKSNAAAASTIPIKEEQQQKQATPTGIDHSSIKPLVLWLCVIGDMVSRVADENEGRQPRPYRDSNSQDCDNQDYGERYPREIYRDCLQGVVGIKTGRDVDTLLTLSGLPGSEGEDLLVMFGLFDPGMIWRRRQLIATPGHVSLLKGERDGDGESEGWMDMEERGDEQEGVGGAGAGWDLRGVLMGILGRV